jgi:hypothetical protein
MERVDRTMKKLIFSLLLCLAICSYSTSYAAPTTFYKYYNTHEVEEIFNMVSAGDGSGYVTIGYSGCFGTGGITGIENTHDLLITKWDGQGVVKWATAVGSYNVFDVGDEIANTSDGGFIVGGRTLTSGNQDVLLVKFNATGVYQWGKLFGGSGTELVGGIVEASNGDIIISGNTNSWGAGNDDAYLARFSSNGTLLWAKAYGNAADDNGNGIALDTSDNIYMTGSTKNWVAGGTDTQDAYVMKVSSDGSTVSWLKVMGGSKTDSRGHIINISNGSYFLTAGGGTSFSVGTGSNWQIDKWDANGNLVWARVIGGNVSEGGITPVNTLDGGFAFAGWSDSYSGGVYSDNLVVKTDSAGNMLWAKSYNGSGAIWSDMIKGFVQDPDGSLIISGEIANLTSEIAASCSSNLNPSLKNAMAFGRIQSDGACCNETTVTPTVQNLTSSLPVTSRTFTITNISTTAQAITPAVTAVQPFVANTDCSTEASSSASASSPSATPVGYNPQWLLITLVCLTLVGGYLLRKRIGRT